jgi:SAM-dependent methyltransferase
MSKFSPFPTWLRLINAKVYESSRETVSLRRAVEREIGDAPGLLYEIGCGFGFNATLRRGDYLGVDPDLRAIEAARRRNPGKRFEIKDVASLNIAGGEVEDVLLCLVIHELTSPVRMAVLAEAARVTQGRICVFDYVRDLRGLSGWWIRFNERPHFEEYLQFDLPDAMRSLGLIHEKHEAISRLFQLDVFGK